MMVCETTVEGVYGSAQFPSAVVPVAVRPQLGALKVPLPGGRLVTPKVTGPLGLGASAATDTVTRTVAWQELVPPVGTLAGLQTRMVVVGWIVAVSTKVSLEPECVASPP